MKITFYKYHATGNDFAIIDNRDRFFPESDTGSISSLCHRRFGIGADGLILLNPHDEVDFEMKYYNADGSISGMCGNGGRAVVAFWRFLGFLQEEISFLAGDGLHYAKWEDDLISLQMCDVKNVEMHSDYLFLDTGSPHHVQLVDDIDEVDVKTIGGSIAHCIPYNEAGTNVNFVQKLDDKTFRIRTYERGVEDETFSCGTGATAVAIAMNKIGFSTSKSIAVRVKGGELKVSFTKSQNTYKNVFLKGSAKQVFKGEITL